MGSVMMKLITNEVKKCLKPLYGAEKDKDPMVCVKFFHPMSNWDWYGIEYDEKQKLMFGLVKGFETELGFFSLDELESVKIGGLGIERDMHWEPRRLSQLKKELKE